MTFKKISNIGSLGAFILMIANILEILSEFHKVTSKGVFISFTYFIGSVLLFISLYECFEYTENSKLACRINLIGVFSMIPLLAFDILAILGHAIPVLSTLYTYTSLHKIASMLSYALIALFLISIYNHHTKEGLKSIVYKAVIASIFINITILIPLSLIFMFAENLSYFSASLSNFSPSFIYTAVGLIFIILTNLSFKDFLKELKYISEKTKDNSVCKT